MDPCKPGDQVDGAWTSKLTGKSEESNRRHQRTSTELPPPPPPPPPPRPLGDSADRSDSEPVLPHHRSQVLAPPNDHAFRSPRYVAKRQALAMEDIPEEGQSFEEAPRPPPRIRSRFSTETPPSRGEAISYAAAPSITSTMRSRIQVPDYSLAGSRERLAQNQINAQLGSAYPGPKNANRVVGLASPFPHVHAHEGSVHSHHHRRSSELLDVEKNDAGATSLRGKRSSHRYWKQSSGWERSPDVNPSHGLSPGSGQTGGLSRPSRTTLREQPSSVRSQHLQPSPRPSSTVLRRKNGPPSDGHSSDDDVVDTAATVVGNSPRDSEWMQHELWRAHSHPSVGFDDDHTIWSSVKRGIREVLAEFLAVVVQQTLGYCANLAVVVSHGRAGNGETTCWASGIASMVAIYIAGGVSGAHLNPATSIMLSIFRGFPLRKLAYYIPTQLFGAYVAALISYSIYRDSILAYSEADGNPFSKNDILSAFLPYPRFIYITERTAFMNDFAGSVVMVVAVLALGDDYNAPPGAGMAAFIISLLGTALGMAFGWQTGAALNAARDLGPRLALTNMGYRGLFEWWMMVARPWFSSISGSVTGALLYDLFVFVGDDSPVKHLWRRMRNKTRLLR